jgi:hypothetical protein
MVSEKEPTTVGLSETGHSNLQRLKEEGYFKEMLDAYRFAIALALSRGAMAEKDSRKTIFNVGTLDPDNLIYSAVSELRTVEDEPVYKTAERLAEWGIAELYDLAKSQKLDFADLLKNSDK